MGSVMTVNDIPWATRRSNQALEGVAGGSCDHTPSKVTGTTTAYEIFEADYVPA
jgi:hypothetical protein